MRTLATLLLVIISIKLHAQKLPNVQQASLHAPANILIDGKPKEWGEQFQAYNKATGIFYSIANDDKNIYLIIYSNNVDIINKILYNGINICFNAKKKSTQGNLLIKYPLGPSTSQENHERSKMMMSKLSYNDGKINAENIEAARLSVTKTIAAENKKVKILGISSFTDTLFSIYDSKDIMVRLNYPEQNLLYYELSVPLKYLEILPSALTELYYNIRLNESFQTRIIKDLDKDANMVTRGGNMAGTVLFATDFWGEYTLAK